MDLKDQYVLVAGAGGFIGGHLVADLMHRGVAGIRAVDISPLPGWQQVFPEVENQILDLRLKEDCETAVDGCDLVINLASSTGGSSYVENNKALCMLNVLINTHLLEASREFGVERYFYASSAGVYSADKQRHTKNSGLREADVYPAMPEDGYGWEKLFSERMCRHFQEDFYLETRVARFHNVYGPHGVWQGGRENAPAAICRKVLEAEMTGNHEIEIWGDGEQTRSFTYVEDCLRGIYQIALCDDNSIPPLNLGSSEIVTINQLVDVVEEISGIKLTRRYNLEAPQGVRGRSSDNTLFSNWFGWEPSIKLANGLNKTYAWIAEEIKDPQKRGGKQANNATSSSKQSMAVQKLKDHLPMFDPLPGMHQLRSASPLVQNDEDDDDFDAEDDDFLAS